MTRFRRLLLLPTFFLYIHLNAQVQLGGDIEGEADSDYSGWALSMPDAHTIAVGGWGNEAAGFDAGHVRVYKWSGNAWVQKGSDIDGEAAEDESGRAVSMPDSNTVAIGAHRNDLAGHVRIYAWDGNAWVQKGADIDGGINDVGNGWSVSMPDANTVAIGARYNSQAFYQAGSVHIYAWNGSAWVPKGADINGEAPYDWLGWSVCMPDANTVAIGSPSGAGATQPMTGYVRIFDWSGNTWVQRGGDIDGEDSDDTAGYAISMPDANTVAIGSTNSHAGATNGGQVRVFAWNGSAWVQKGGNMNGDIANNHFGWSVSMPDANTVAAGGPTNGFGFTEGYVRVFAWDANAWVQAGTDIVGEAAGDNSGYAVCMPDAQTVAIGAPFNGGSATRAGHVRVYGVNTVGIDATPQAAPLRAYPNPSTGLVSIEGDAAQAIVSVIVLDALGRPVSTQAMQVRGRMQVSLPEARGVYFLHLLRADGSSGYTRVVRE